MFGYFNKWIVFFKYGGVEIKNSWDFATDGGVPRVEQDRVRQTLQIKILISLRRGLLHRLRGRRFLPGRRLYGKLQRLW